MAKLIDVARAAGVSAASASRALNGGQAVSPELRRRVESAAARLAYRPNVSAQVLASGAKRIAVVSARLIDPVIAGVSESVARALINLGHGATIISAPIDDGAWLRGFVPSGVVFVGLFPAPSQLQPIAGVPWLAVADEPSEIGLCLELGLAGGWELACRYLSTEGHRRIGLLDTSTKVSAAMLSLRLNHEALSLKDIRVEMPDVAPALRQAFELVDRPTALVCSSDAMALAALRYCAIERIAVPQEVSIIGFGDALFARYSYPALSSVRVPTEAISAASAKAILELLLGRSPVLSSPQPRLVIRESSGPVVSRGA